jgi:hypothetical protein
LQKDEVPHCLNRKKSYSLSFYCPARFPITNLDEIIGHTLWVDN